MSNAYSAMTMAFSFDFIEQITHYISLLVYVTKKSEAVKRRASMDKRGGVGFMTVVPSFG